MTTDYISFSYAALIAIGGTIGYVKSGSAISLAAGLTFGTILGAGAYQTSKDPSNCYLSLTTNVVLASLMGVRSYSSGKFMPSGLIACCSAIMLCRHGAQLLSGLSTKQPPTA